jgi:nitrogen fixation NifU-like protein
MMFDDVRDLYQEVILDRGRQPRHGSRPAAWTASARGDNPMCGDRCAVFVDQAPDGTLRTVGFEARGCAISIASADLMVEAAQGATPATVQTLAEEFRLLARTGMSDDPALEALRPLAGVHEYPSRVKCAMLPWHALLAALQGEQEASSE